MCVPRCFVESYSLGIKRNDINTLVDVLKTWFTKREPREPATPGRRATQKARLPGDPLWQCSVTCRRTQVSAQAHPGRASRAEVLRADQLACHQLGLRRTELATGAGPGVGPLPSLPHPSLSLCPGPSLPSCLSLYLLLSVLLSFFRLFSS